MVGYYTRWVTYLVIRDATYLTLMLLSSGNCLHQSCPLYNEREGLLEERGAQDLQCYWLRSQHMRLTSPDLTLKL